MRGRTGICVFDGIMKKELYIEILDQTLLPFLYDKFGDGNYRFMQDNDPKHVALLTQAWLRENEVNWWLTPPESPDINPIENMWHELKEYIRREAKPHTKDELVAAIISFWNTVDVAKCTKYIRHLRKVVPKVIALEGGPTGY